MRGSSGLPGQGESAVRAASCSPRMTGGMLDRPERPSVAGRGGLSLRSIRAVPERAESRLVPPGDEIDEGGAGTGKGRVGGGVLYEIGEQAVRSAARAKVREVASVQIEARGGAWGAGLPDQRLFV